MAGASWRWILAAAGAALAVPALAFDEEAFKRRARQDPPPAVLSIAEHRVVLHERVPGEDEGAFLTIDRAGRRVMRLAEHSLEIAHRRADGEPGPDLIVVAYSGGAHCCFSVHAISLAPPFRDQIIDVRDGEPEVVPGRRGEAPRLRFHDFAFAYWRASFAESPAPEIWLRWTGSRYAVDAAAMRKPAPNERALVRLASDIAAAWTARKAAGGEAGPPPLLWRHLLDLVYAGNAASARALFERAWIQSEPGKDEFWRALTQQLRQGRLWREYALESALGARALFAN